VLIGTATTLLYFHKQDNETNTGNFLIEHHCKKILGFKDTTLYPLRSLDYPE
jgi:hypothetical protein